MDKNGYNPSLIKTTRPDTCLVCGKIGIPGDFARHEVFHGPLRKVSKQEGMWIYVCPECHEYLHQHQNDIVDISLKRAMQALYEEKNGHEAFMQLIGKNYL